MNGNLHEDRYTFMNISRSVLLGMRNVSQKRFSENQNTHFVFFNFSQNSTVYEIMWKSIVEPEFKRLSVKAV